ncbi:MAG: uracil-DNA glycosylase [Rhodoferax sp.]|uniref:uracil-DNA glycosylase n=1 Tax=Rhodoferax sp. TaxID=50421 RepID=UPI003016ED64
MQPDLFPGGSPRLTAWAPQHWLVAEGWRPVMDHFLTSQSGQQLATFIQLRLAQGATIYPPEPFRALALTPLAEVKVVILGQDPYHGPGQAEGLAFSVGQGVKMPPSLRNIVKEIARERSGNTLGASAIHQAPAQGSLVHWAEQGVLLLNTCLTVEDGLPASHAQHGWEALTDALVKAVAEKESPVVFMLWGAHAQSKATLIGNENEDKGSLAHLVLTANHPSPLSAMRAPKPFMGCGHFGLANNFLKLHGEVEIDW